MSPSFTGPTGIALFRLIAMRSAVKLESHGIQVRRGPKITPMAKREMGLKRNASTEQVLAALDQAISDAKHAAAQVPGSVTP